MLSCTVHVDLLGVSNTFISATCVKIHQTLINQRAVMVKTTVYHAKLAQRGKFSQQAVECQHICL